MENKLLVSLVAPIFTRSGYGDRGRDLARAILRSGKYDLKIWPINWGMTPYIGLDENDPEDKAILNCILKSPELHKQPDIHLHLSVPNEFQPVGKYNIGITAGIETDHVDASWLEGANKMNLLLVSSEHSKKGFTDTTYHQKDQNTGNVMAELKLTTPVEVLFEGLDVSTFFKTDELENTIVTELQDIKEDWLFLFCGHWLSGDIGQDRKDVGMLIKTFFEAFKNKKKKPALLLKMSGGGTSITDRKNILDKIDTIRKTCSDTSDLPNVYLLHGNLSRKEMNSLYNHPKVKAHISFTKGEGYGRPLLEASVSAKPIIVTKHSGYLDFLDHVVWIPGTLTPIHPSAQWQGVLNPGTNWFTADYGSAGGWMREVFENYKNYTDLGKRQAYKSRNEFTLEKMGDKLVSILDAAAENLPKQVQLKLPQLKKIELPKLKKVEEETTNG
jgi:glycosyltransferase involved in cell wall biosynthesis